MLEETNGCRIIEVAHGLKQRNVFIGLDQLDEWQKAQPDIELYTSYFRYYEPDPEVGPVLAGFIMDSDDRDNPERARKDTILIIKVLIDKYGLAENDVSVAFSGKKGFHVAVNRRALGAEPHAFLPKIFKQMAKELIAQNGLKTLDLQIYDRRRLIRLINSRHHETQLYKIPLTFSELQNLTVDKIKVMATQRRLHLTHETPHQLSEKAHAWLTRNIDSYMQSLEDKRTEYSNEDFQNTDILPCVRARLEKGSERGYRNRHCWQLATYFNKKGLPLEECLAYMKPWHSRLEQASDDPYTWTECETTIKYVYETQKYSIGCTSEYAEGVCVGKDKCPLFKPKPQETTFTPEALTEAQKHLTKSPLAFMADTVNKIHVGDRELIKIAYISALSATLANAIHLWPIGTSQKGKSHVLYYILPTLPTTKYEIFTSASPKSLFFFAKEHGEDCFNGKIIYIDEVESSKFTLPMLRTLTSKTDITPRHLSVYDSELLDLKITGPRTVWFTSIKPFGAEQMRNRFIFANPDEWEQQDTMVHKLQIEDKENTLTKDIPEYQTAEAMTSLILRDTKDLKVTIPYLDKIVWPFTDKRWLFPIFKDFIKTIAKIYFKQHTIENGEILATLKDFQIAKALWKHFERHIIYRASTPAQTVLDHLALTRDDAKTKAALSDETGYSTKHLGRLLEELAEANLINAERVQGSKAYRYWKAKIPTVDQIDIKDIGILSDQTDTKSMDMGFCTSQKNLGQSELEPNRVPDVHSVSTGGAT